MTLPGDRLVLFTDGLLEATSPDGEELGAERLAGILRETAALGIEEHLPAALAAVEKWCRQSRFSDDVSAICIEAVRS